MKEGAAESLELLSDGMDAMFCAAGFRPGTKRYHEGADSFFLDISHSSPGKQTWKPTRLDQLSSDGLDLKNA